MVSNYYTFFGIFLVSMLFVPPSMPTAAAQDSEIPAWIKNNAGWWATDQIKDEDFVKGIKYLMDNLVLQVPTNQQSNEYGVLKLNEFQYELPGRQDITTASLFGKFSGGEIGTTLIVKVTKPDGKIGQENIKISKDAVKFTYSYLIKYDFPTGEYQITVSVGSAQLGPISFTVKEKTDEEKSIPFWIKNTAGWWADGQIDDSEFVNALQFLVKEKIIKIEQKKASILKGMDPELLVYHTKLTEVPDVILNNKLIRTEPYTAVMVYSTQDEYCSAEEKRNASAYAKMSEYLLNKLHRPNTPTEVIGVCMELHEIKGNTYPLTLKEVGVASAQMVIYVGGLEANLESYDDVSAVGWWQVDCGWVNKDGERGWKCAQNQIVVCDGCRVFNTFSTDSPPVNARDSEIAIERGMQTLAHEIGHSNHYEKNGDGLYWDGWWRNAYATSIHDNQEAFDYCHQQGLLENELCKKLYEKVKINDRTYLVMNINYAINNWKEEQKEVLEEIKELVGSGANVDGFNKAKYYESHEKDETENYIVKDIFSIEFPDDFTDEMFEYNWYYWWGNGTSDPKDQVTEPCCDVWEADKAILKFEVELHREESCTACREYKDGDFGLTYIQSEVLVWLLENVHSAGKSDEVILDVIKDGEWEWCNGLTKNRDGFECQNFEVKEKTVYLTDEGRKAYTVVYEFTKFFIDPSEPLNFQIKYEPMVYTSTEIHDGNDAWYITTETMKDTFDKNPEQIYRFIESFAVIDYNTPVSTVTIPKTPEPTPEPTPVTPPDTSGFYWGALVELDKVYYSLEDNVNIIVTAPNFNANSNVIEYIGTDANSRVTITTSQGTLDFYKLKETSPDSGVFEGSVSLNSANTSGTGPWSGKIKTSNQDIITIEFTNTYSGKADTVTTQGFVNYNTPP